MITCATTYQGHLMVLMEVLKVLETLSARVLALVDEGLGSRLIRRINALTLEKTLSAACVYK